MTQQWIRRMVCSMIVITSAMPALQNDRVELFRWPQVQSLARSYYFPLADTAEIRLSIQSLDGKPLYLFQCGPGYKYPDGSIENIECGLGQTSYNLETDNSLLAEDPFDGAIAHTRGEVWANELGAGCMNYPDWGAARSFRLRGMKLSLKFRRVRFATETNQIQHGASRAPREVLAIRSFQMDVVVEEDRTALGAIAEPTPFASPASFRTAFFETRPDCGTPRLVHVVGTVDQEYVTANGLGPPFPEVMPEEKIFLVRGSPHPTYFQFAGTPIPPNARIVDLSIDEPNGKLAYEFECSAYNVPIEIGRIDRFGIVCGLFAKGRGINLLEEGLDPYSRMNPAQILPDQLYGGCAKYPQWGANREFNLRGMHLTLGLSDPIFTPGEFAAHALQSVRLTVKVAPEASATSPVAQPSKYIYWGSLHSQNACDTVLVNPHLGNQN